MTYLISGSSGFIGQNLIKYLEERSHRIIEVPRYQWYDMNEPYEFIHLAAYGNHYTQKDAYETFQANIQLLWQYIEYVMEDNNCKKFYNISTSAIQLPTDTLYSVSKRFGELMVESYNDPRFVNIRPYSVYGPGEADHRFIPTVIRALHSGEEIPLELEAKHDWVLVTDFIKAMFEGNKYIGSGQSYSNGFMVDMLEDISGKTLNYRLATLRNYDTEDWVCPFGVEHIDIYEGLKQTYEWFTQKNLRDKQEA